MIDEKGILELEGMEFRANHGCLEEERRDGNIFTVDFRAEIPLAAAAASDCLSDTLDYSAVYDIVAAQMAVPSNLLENVAARIASAIEEAFPGLEHFSLRVSKKNPPVGGTAVWSRITVSK